MSPSNSTKLPELVVTLLEGVGVKRTIAELANLLEKPKDSKKGDFALPCFLFAKQLSKAPPVVAKDLHEKLYNENHGLLSTAGVEKAVAMGPYLNFYLDRALLAGNVIPEILKDGKYFETRSDIDVKTGKKKDKVMVEYSQPNTHKAFHVGHLRNASLGDSIRRLLEWNGHEVVPVNYIGDEGAHVAKALWHFRYQFPLTGAEIPKTNLGEFLGDQYSKGTEMQSLDSYTAVSKPGVRAALVTKIDPHPDQGFTDPKGKKPYANWKVVELEMPESSESDAVLKKYTVVTGAVGFEKGDLVAYAGVGIKLDKKMLTPVDKRGISSEGMILSEKETGLTDDNNKVAVLPKKSPTTEKEIKNGDHLVEIYRFKYPPTKDSKDSKPFALPYDQPVLDTFLKRKEECSQVLQAIESGKGEIYEQWKETKEWSMEEFRRIYKWIDARFDDWFYESEYGESSKALVREFMVPNPKDCNKGKGEPAFKQSEGAVGADLTKAKLGFCLLIKSDGTALYATRDLALAQKKFEKYGIEKSLYVVDDAQTLHFQQVFKCLELMGYEQAKKCKHLAYAQVVLPDGKMSSRKGNVILFSQLEKALKDRIKKEHLDKHSDWSQKECENAAHLIALASMRYGMLNQDMGGQITFDLDAWCSATGNTGPYLLYAYARTRSILRGLAKSLTEKDDGKEQLDKLKKFIDFDDLDLKSACKKDTKTEDLPQLDYSLLSHEIEHELIGYLFEYPSLIESAATSILPVEVCKFAYTISKTFSSWFQKKECSCLHSTGDLQLARALLVQAIGKTLQHALSLIGIKTLEKM